MNPLALRALLTRVPAWVWYIVAAVALVVAAMLAWNHWLNKHDTAVVAKHEATISDQVSQATQAANDTANANDAKRQAENAAASQQTKDTIAHAEEKDPEAAKAAAGPIARAAVDSLRNRGKAASRPASH